MNSNGPLNHTHVVGPVARRCSPIAALGIVVTGAYLLGLHRYLTLDMLRAHRETILAFSDAYPILAPLALGSIYVTVVTFSLPGAAVLTITCGFLLGNIWGTLHAVTSATLGASILFAVASTSIGRHLRQKADSWVGRFRTGFQRNAFTYLLVLRLIPLFPFFVVNLVPALLGVPLRIFVAGTFIGSLPGSFVYASFGAGIAALIDAGADLSPALVITPDILIALIGLALLALAPLLYRKIRTRTVEAPMQAPAKREPN